MHTYLEKGMYRAWLEDGRSFEISWNRWRGFMFELSESHLTFAVPRLYIAIPYPKSKHPDDIDINAERRYGFAAYFDTLHLHWGRESPFLGKNHSKVYTWPWADWKHVRHELLTELETHNYIYTLKSGETQVRQATIRVEEREWRLAYSRSPIKKISRYLEVSFDNEIGEESGSWKGGTIGCTYEILPGEKPIDTLRRMEVERKF